MKTTNLLFTLCLSICAISTAYGIMTDPKREAEYARIDALVKLPEAEFQARRATFMEQYEAARAAGTLTELDEQKKYEFGMAHHMRVYLLNPEPIMIPERGIAHLIPTAVRPIIITPSHHSVPTTAAAREFYLRNLERVLAEPYQPAQAPALEFDPASVRFALRIAQALQSRSSAQQSPNPLVITASAQDQRRLFEIIDRLDVPQFQGIEVPRVEEVD